MKKKLSQKLIPIKTSSALTSKATRSLLHDIRGLIETTRHQVAQAVNTGLVLLYWQIGKRIRQDFLDNKRAPYGEQIVTALGTQLTADYGRGFQPRNLFRMMRFFDVYPDQQIVAALSAQLGWTHFRQIIHFEDSLKRDFYAEMCRVERWSTRTLEKKIGGMLFERTGLSRKPRKLAEQELAKLRKEDQWSPALVFRDPYFLDFLELSDSYSEKDLESAILRELERFLIEFGTDFTFVARQKRMQLDDKDYYLDLLFYHRGMRCLVAVELKLSTLQPGDMGQMEFYLRWLEKYDKRTGENPPLGLILCAGKGREQVEVLQLDKRGIHVADYLTQLPSRKILEKKLHQAIQRAQERLTTNKMPRK
jgi:predicted nuclease of restriction endonuclease-like (RecB) superfamily